MKVCCVLWKSGGKFRESMERARFINAWAPNACHPSGHPRYGWVGRPSNMVHGVLLESGERKVAKLSGKRKEMKDQMVFTALRIRDLGGSGTYAATGLQQGSRYVSHLL